MAIDFNEYGIEMWSEDKKAAFRKALLEWYDHHKRDLPWRQTSDPYAIWISEIMLQQTQVATVIPYYLRFMEWFKTPKDLAGADTEKVIKAWEGLGYYSRARNLQAAAQTIVTKHDGIFPRKYEDVRDLKGIGPYTAGAIMSIAFNKPYSAVDGNVMRIMARLFEIDLDVGDPKNRKVFEAVTQELLDPNRPGDFNQALMDLGTDIESAKGYHVEDSPVKGFSAAYLNETMAKYPIKLPKKKPVNKTYIALVVESEDQAYLFEKRPDKGLLKGFWMMPLIEELPDVSLEVEEKDSIFKTKEKKIKRYLNDLGYSQLVVGTKPIESVVHVFSHQRWTIEIWYVRALEQGFPQNANAQTSVSNLKWLSASDFSRYAFPKPQHKIWEAFLNN